MRFRVRPDLLRGSLLALAAAAILFALFFARPHGSPGSPMRDFEAYYAAGTTWAQGGNPYTLQIWSAERRLDGVNPNRLEALPFVGPPALLPLFALVAKWPYGIASLVWRFVLALSIVTLLIATLVLLERRLSAWNFLALAVVALGFGPLTSAFALGQLALPAADAVTIAFALANRSRLGAACAAFVATMQPNTAPALFALLRWRTTAYSAIGGVALFLIVCIGVSGITGLRAYIQMLQAHSAAETFSAIQITPGAILFGAGLSAGQAVLCGAVVAALAIVIWIAAMRAPIDNTIAFCATAALLPFVLPFFHEHDLVLLFPAAVLLFVRAPSRVAPLILAGALFCATDWLGLAQRPAGTLQAMLLVGAAGIALLLLRDRIEVATAATIAVTLAVIALAGFFAHAHPLPVWPDAMNSSLVHGGSISAVWHAEQAATSLFARSVFWALLRALSLAGCAVLAYSAINSRSFADSKRPVTVPA